MRIFKKTLILRSYHVRNTGQKQKNDAFMVSQFKNNPPMKWESKHGLGHVTDFRTAFRKFRILLGKLRLAQIKKSTDTTPKVQP